MHKNLLILPESCRPQKILHSSQVRELLYVNNGIEFPSAHNKDYTFNIPSADLSTNLTSIIKEMTLKDFCFWALCTKTYTKLKTFS